MDRFLTLLGLARRAGQVAMGETPVYEAAARGRARVVFLAADAAGNTGDKLRRKLGETPLQTVPFGKRELGRALGREVCAMAAVLDAGFARSLTGTLEETSKHHDGGVTS